ncbi:carbohydrate ABC transporter membrane protein 1 (CUT1 family) [Cohnella phaseoli]|uniref:Carbohydrate ABC transporter membrane protein 1 (CUT1 family) n=2 Tax=Cohnella phaseoli TaxID=456490 RepID=A0A3D9IP60_9BACL|nr:carbohydrate ABC transporter membrane protein 1 (CUT1 family) [Cohnella phaseoli]
MRELRNFLLNKSLHLMVWIGMIFVVVFSYVPMLGIIISFKQYRPVLGFMKSKWVGWDNFSLMLKLPDFYQVVTNTLVIAGLKLTIGFFVPIMFALLLNEVRLMWFKKTVQTFVYLPHFMSWVILGGILTNILSVNGGIVNNLLGWFGIDPIMFLGSNAWFRPVLIVSDIWKEFGFSMIVYLAALAGINPALYEAAVIDGANRWKQTLYVTLPGIVPIMALVATLSLGGILNAGFDQVFNLYNPIVYETGDIIDTYVYRMGLQQTQYSFATAVGLSKSLVSLILMAIAYRLAYKYANYRIF